MPRNEEKCNFIKIYLNDIITNSNISRNIISQLFENIDNQNSLDILQNNIKTFKYKNPISKYIYEGYYKDVLSAISKLQGKNQDILEKYLRLFELEKIVNQFYNDIINGCIRITGVYGK